MSDTETRYVDPDTWWERLYPGDQNRAADAPASASKEPGRTASRWDWRSGVDLLAKDAPSSTENAEPEVGDEPEKEPEPVPEPLPEDALDVDSALVPDEPTAAVPRWWSEPPAWWRRATEPHVVGDHRATARRRLHRALYTLTAGAAGYGTPVGSWLHDYLAVCATSPGGVAAFAVETSAMLTAWYASPEVSKLLPSGYRAFLRPVAVIAAGTWAWGLRGGVAYETDRLGPWAYMLAPVTAGLGLTGLCWWLVDRHTRHLPRLLAWAARIPAATCGLALALYAPGPIHL